MIVGLFPDLLSVGGVQTAGRQTAASLAALSRQLGQPYQFLSLNDPEAEHWATVDGLPFCFHGFHRARARFVDAAMELAQSKPTVVLASHPHLALPAQIMKMRSPRLRVIVMTHGIEVWRPLPFARRWALRQADLVLAPSNDTARHVVEIQGVFPERVSQLPWCLDPDFRKLAAQADSFLLPPGFPEGRVILSVGRWAATERYKGVDCLLRAMPEILKQVPDAHLVAVGDGDDRPRLEEIARTAEVAQRVHFLRAPSKGSLIACYSKCDVFALPSSGEGFGFVLLEAMALAKPVVGGAYGGTLNLIEDGVNGFLVRQEDNSRIVETLARLLTDENLRRELGEKARVRVLAQFSFEHFQAQLGNILQAFDVL